MDLPDGDATTLPRPRDLQTMLSIKHSGPTCGLCLRSTPGTASVYNNTMCA